MVRISDNQLIQLLEENARMPFTEMAKRLGVSEAAIRKRIKSLEDKGVIQGYRPIINSKKLNEVQILLGIDTTSEEYMHILELLAKIPEIKSLFTSSGDHMIMANIRIEEKRMSEIITKIENLKGVTKTCPAVILNRIK